LLAWAALLLAAVAVTATHLQKDETWIRSNVFELLPAADYDPLKEVATRVVDAELGTRLLFFVGHENRESAMRAADSLGRVLASSPLLNSITTRVDESAFSAMAGFYYPYRSRILSDQQIERISSDPEGLEAEALTRLYSPFGTGGSSLSTDPFSLFPGSLQSLQPAGNALRLEDGYLWAERGGRSYIFVMANLISGTLSISDQEQLASRIDGALADLAAEQSGIDVLKTGFPFYAHEATRSAKGEVSTIGIGSLIGLLLLVILTFRSLSPLSLIVISIMAGCAFGLAVTLSIFGFVHLFTLVFGASLIGVSVDYSFHYIADDAFGGEDWTPGKGLQNIFTGISLGLATSILAYLALTVAPFPGLQQLAVFSSAGLTGAYLTLIAMTQLKRRRFVLHQRTIVLSVANYVLNAWRQRSATARTALMIVLAVVVLAAQVTVDINDDVRMLQSQPASLVEQEAAIQEMLGVAQAGTFLLVAAENEELLLQKEESIRTRLDTLIAGGELDSYQAVSRWVPSQLRQQRSYEVYAGFAQSRLAAFYDQVGADETAARDAIANIMEESPALDIATWLQHPASEQFRSLWLDAGEGGSASIILLFGVKDLATLDELNAINKGSELSSLFGQYRSRVMQLLIAAYALILLGLSFRYGLRRATNLVLPPIVAGFLALLLIDLTGGTLNLFNYLALILVLGIGIDFTIFIAEARHDLTSTMFAITLSALTTILSFGLLALSSTFAVHSFGITVLIGIAFAYLLCPVAMGARANPS